MVLAGHFHLHHELPVYMATNLKRPSRLKEKLKKQQNGSSIGWPFT
uniref:Uncharacterized protein n=1 Tax=Pyxicephalus adspersus TaxID=30357 RepID=A0AAV3ABY9_PYXAD|nr:TPA: hypothetical protein GDO54_017563 [Pyxicephalus adspersus]